MDTIALILVHHNTFKDTRECLTSLAQISAKGFKYRIIIVDNGSQEPFVLPRALERQEIEVIRSESNLGFTGGNNLGITYARDKYEPDYFLLLNTDTVVDPEFLSSLYKRSEQENNTGLVTPKIYFAPGFEYHQKRYRKAQQGKVLWYAGGSIDWSSLTAFHRGVDEVDRGQFELQQESEFATGCCLLIPRVVIETIGLLDKRFFLYFEDTQFSLRCLAAGVKIYFEPTAIVWHKNAGSSGGAGGPTSEYYQTRNRLLLALEYAPVKVKITALRLAFQFLFSGNQYQRKAAIDFIFQRYGKQQIV